MTVYESLPNHIREIAHGRSRPGFSGGAGKPAAPGLYPGCHHFAVLPAATSGNSCIHDRLSALAESAKIDAKSAPQTQQITANYYETWKVVGVNSHRRRTPGRRAEHTHCKQRPGDQKESWNYELRRVACVLTAPPSMQLSG